MKRKKSTQPKVRSVVAVAAHLRGGAGTHGGSPRLKNRRDRQAVKRALKDGGE